MTSTLFLRLYMSIIPIVEQVKYANNYDYNKAVYLMSEFKLLDNGFLILKETTAMLHPSHHFVMKNMKT